MRRYDIDAIRVIALVLLIVYHVAISFGETDFDGDWVMNDGDLSLLTLALQALNIWRIPILFLVAGMALRFSMERRSMGRLARERMVRLGVPLVFGAIFINPLWFVASDLLYERELRYIPSELHLWFLTPILLYSVVLAPLFYYLKNHPRNLVFRIAGRMLRQPFGFGVWLMLALPLAVAGALINPEIYPLFVVDWSSLMAVFFGEFELVGRLLHGSVVGLICFGVGFLFVSQGSRFWTAVRDVWRFALPLAVVLYILRVVFLLFEIESDDGLLRIVNTLTGIEAASWMVSALALGAHVLNRPSRRLTYATVAVFPVYIFHFPLQNALGALIYPLPLPVYLEFLLTTLAIIAISILFYELVKRVPKVRLVFGLKP